jgi:ADP-ribose pyrophosphatase
MNFLPSPGGSDEHFTLFVGRADLSRAGGIHGLAEEGEDIRVNVLSVNQALAALQSGRINNASCIVALQWLALNKPRLLTRWKNL